MTPIPTIGFSAFLRLICQNEKPQKTAIRNRHKPSKKGGYDFHKSLRRNIQKLASGSASLEEVLKTISEIKKKPERVSAKRGLERFVAWKHVHAGKIEFCEAITFSSPKGLFRIQFQADFIMELSGRRTAVHVWNTKSKLSGNLVMAALTLVARNWPIDDRPDDFAVLSLQDGQLYRWFDDPNNYIVTADAIVAHLDRLCDLARKDFDLPPVNDHPEPPPPPGE